LYASRVKTLSDAAERNKGPIGEALAEVLPEQGHVLELASGSGQHVVSFARRFPALTFHPSDAMPAALASIAAHVDESGVTNVVAPVRIDVAEPRWARSVDAVLCINMVQVVPEATIPHLFAGAAECLASGAPLVLYGPYREGAEYFSEGNRSFDATLKQRNPTFGVRDIGDLSALGAAAGFSMETKRPMPANNHLLVFRKTAGADVSR